MKVLARCIRLSRLDGDIKSLRKRHRSVEQDLIYAERLLEAGQIQIKSDTTPYPSFGERRVYKTRVIDTRSSKGKSSGYRLIYEEYSPSTEDIMTVVLVLLYDHNTFKNENMVRAEVKLRLKTYECDSI